MNNWLPIIKLLRLVYLNPAFCPITASQKTSNCGTVVTLLMFCLFVTFYLLQFFNIKQEQTANTAKHTVFSQLEAELCMANEALYKGFHKQEYWTGLPSPSPGDLPDPGIEPRSPALQADSLLAEPSGNLTRTDPFQSTDKTLTILCPYFCIIFL